MLFLSLLLWQFALLFFTPIHADAFFKTDRFSFISSEGDEAKQSLADNRSQETGK